METKHNISGALRQAAKDSEYTQVELAKLAGLDRTSLGRFMRGERSLRLDLAARLAECLGLELRPIKRNKTK